MTAPLSLQHTYQDLRWTDDMDPMAAETDTDFESLTQDVLHILVENLASNLADPDNGIGILNYLNSSSLNSVPSIADTQLATVSRITSSTTSLSGQQADGSYLVQVQIATGLIVQNVQFVLNQNGLTVVDVP